MKKEERYFIVFFAYQHGNDDIAKKHWKHSNYGIFSPHYPNRNKAVELIKADNTARHNISITNVIEVTEEDYDNWISEKKEE